MTARDALDRMHDAWLKTQPQYILDLYPDALDKQPGPTPTVVSPAGLLIEGRARRREPDGSPALKSRRPPEARTSPDPSSGAPRPSARLACGAAE